MSFPATTLVVILLAATAVAFAAAAPPCAQVTQLMPPCMPYLTGPLTTPYGMCCNSIRLLNQLAPTASDRVAVCNCLKSAAASFPAVDFSRATDLPRLCGVPLNIAVSPNMDCNKVAEEAIRQ